MILLLRNDCSVIFCGIVVLLATALSATAKTILPKQAPNFIIVGGGTSGCVLASRLCSSLPRARILLLERGQPRSPDDEFLVRSARSAFAAWVAPNVTESFPSLPNPGLNGRPVDLLTGNTLGGSSAINALQWTIPARGTWERYGIPGLTTSKARQLYKRVYRKVGFSTQPTELKQIYAKDYIRAARKAGFPEDRDQFNDRAGKGVGNIRVAVDPRGRRVDSCTAYLEPVRNGLCRKNLNVLEGVTVTKVITSKAGPPLVTGVKFIPSGDSKRSDEIIVHAEQEVLLAAGPYGTPKLLQLSGIGPRNLLNRHNIPLIKNLPVGAKTQARSVAAIVSMYSGKPLEPANNSTLLESPEARKQFEEGRGGVFGTAVGAVDGRLRKIAYILATMVAPMPEADNTRFITSLCFLNPGSFGFLRIKSKNPLDTPEVQLNLMNSKNEVNRAKRCLKSLSTIHDRFPLSFNLSDILPVGPFTEQFIRDTSRFSAHFVGGCAVGSVVNGDLRVRGVDGIRVIDVSVFGTIPTSAGPMASTYVLAEFMSDKLIRMYKSQFDMQ